MTTVYTVNNKVLKNSATDKWLAKKEAPVPTGFVMDASNAEYYEYNGLYAVAWPSPSYPNSYIGNGKQYILVNNNTAGVLSDLCYLPESKGMGPSAIEMVNLNEQGTSTGTLLDNIYYGPFENPNGVYLGCICGYTLEDAQAYVANISITIVDP